MTTLEHISVQSVYEISSHVQNEDDIKKPRKKDLRWFFGEDPKKKRFSYRYGFHIISILAFCAVLEIPLLLIPRTNSIIYQSSWLEFNLPLVLFMILMAGNDLLNLIVWSKEKSLRSFSVLYRLYVLYTMAWIFPYVVGHWFWCSYLGYYHPIPYLGFNFIISQIVFMVGIWFMLPFELLGKPEFQAQLKIYTLYFLWSLIIMIQNEILAFLFTNLPSEWQWIMAFLIPSLRELDKSIRSKMVTKMAGNKDEKARVLLGIAINLFYALFVAIRFVGAEPATAYCIMTVDFVLHLRMTYQTIQVHNSVTSQNDENHSVEKQASITKLILAELTEGIVPLAYAITFAMAYYGPNATILGNVKNDYWAYEKVDDISHMFRMLFLLFAVDTVSVLFNALLLWKAINVNLFKEFSIILGKYWFFVATKLAMLLMANFATNDVNLGMDSTFEFDWITAAGRARLMNISTDSSNETLNMLLFNVTIP